MDNLFDHPPRNVIVEEQSFNLFHTQPTVEVGPRMRSRIAVTPDTGHIIGDAVVMEEGQ